MKQSNLASRPETRQKDISHDQVAAMAYQLYLQNGCCDGKDQEYWFQAEQLLAKEKSQPTQDKAPHINIDQPTRIQPVDQRQQPLARDERGSATREDIRRESTPMRPASRQSNRSNRSERAPQPA